MRLTPTEIAAIKAAARDAFGETVVVRLFGSRVDDHRRGGDIDLHVEVDPPFDIWKTKDTPGALASELTLPEIWRLAAANPQLHWIDFTGGEPTDRSWPGRAKAGCKLVAVNRPYSNA